MVRKSIRFIDVDLLFLFFVSINILLYLSFALKFPMVKLTLIFEVFTVIMLIQFLVQLFSGKKKFSNLELIIWILLLWIFILHLLWYPEIVANGGVNEFWKTAGGTVLLTLLMWLFGINLGINFSNNMAFENLKGLLWFIFIAYSITFFYGTFLGYKNYGVWLFYFKNYEALQGFNYIGYGDLYAFLSLIMLWVSRDLKLKILIYTISSVALFLSFSRTSFYLYLIWGSFYIFTSLKNNKEYRKSLILFNYLIISFFTFFLFYIAFSNSRFSSLIFIKRMSSILINPFEDASTQSRMSLLKEGLDFIRENWLFGKYMSEWWYTNTTGTYIHNWLSFWASYGIGPFMLFLIASLWALLKSYIVFKKTKDPFLFALFSFSISAIIISRSYTWPYIWFAMGCVSTFKVRLEGYRK